MSDWNVKTLSRTAMSRKAVLDQVESLMQSRQLDFHIHFFSNKISKLTYKTEADWASRGFPSGRFLCSGPIMSSCHSLTLIIHPPSVAFWCRIYMRACMLTQQQDLGSLRAKMKRWVTHQSRESDASPELLQGRIQKHCEKRRLRQLLHTDVHI